MGFNTLAGAHHRMACVRINGVELADAVKADVKGSVLRLQRDGIEACLATILVGDDQASATYVRKKHEACAEVGISAIDHRLGAGVGQGELNALIERLNSDTRVHGILLQLPLPGHLDASEAISRISPGKDVDGLGAANMGRLAAGQAGLVPCTPLAVMYMLDHFKIDLAGKTVVVINRSSLVGKPLYQLLLGRDATVITCHSKTRDIAKFSGMADVVITAVGDRKRFELTPDMISDGCVVIDVAITRHNGRLAGDADYERVASKASHATPVPGGVGPMTVAMLLKNTTAAAAGANGIEL